MGSALPVPILGFSCEMDSDEINFIIWAGKGKNNTRIKCFAILGLLCGLYNVLVADVQGQLQKDVKCPWYLGRILCINCLFHPSGILKSSEELSCLRLWLFYWRQFFFCFSGKYLQGSDKPETSGHGEALGIWVFVLNAVKRNDFLNTPSQFL